MKIAEMNGCVIHTFPALKTMVIVEPDAIFIRCLLCGEVKSVHMLTDDNRSLPWMRQCYCNAPDDGGDKQPEEPEPAMPLDVEEKPGLAPTMTPTQAFDFMRHAVPGFQSRLVHRRDEQ